MQWSQVQLLCVGRSPGYVCSQSLAVQYLELWGFMWLVYVSEACALSSHISGSGSGIRRLKVVVGSATSRGSKEKAQRL